MQRKVISVVLEIDELLAALDGARSLADAIRNDNLVGGEVTPTAATISAIISLAHTRLRDLARCVRGTVGVDAFWTQNNDGQFVLDQDVLLTDGSSGRRVRARRGPR